MVNVLWKACVGEEAQGYRGVCGDVGGDSRYRRWYHPIGGFEREQCFLIGREFGAISDRSCRHDKLAPTVVDFAWSVSEFSRALGHEFCDLVG